jgi:hypothetical protein
VGGQVQKEVGLSATHGLCVDSASTATVWPICSAEIYC